MHVVFISLRVGTTSSRATIIDKLHHEQLNGSFLKVSVFAVRMRWTYRKLVSKKRQDSTERTQTSCNIDVGIFRYVHFLMTF